MKGGKEVLGRERGGGVTEGVPEVGGRSVWSGKEYPRRTVSVVTGEATVEVPLRV